jgi:acetoin utilization protein AcuB
MVLRPPAMPTLHPRLRIDHFMTGSPHSIGFDQPLALAHETMRRLDIRHLPVLRAGELVGLVSLRDLQLLESLAGVDPQRVTVEDAMTVDVFAVHPDAEIGAVAAEMARHKYGCAVVMSGDTVVGIFTTSDALHAIVALAPPVVEQRAVAS